MKRKHFVVFLLLFINCLLNAKQQKRVEEKPQDKFQNLSEYSFEIADIKGILYDGKYDTALSRLDALLKKYPMKSEIYILMGDALLRLNAFEEAYKSYLKAIYKNSDSVVYDRIKETLSRMENNKLVAIKLREAIAVKPNDFILRNILASFYIELTLYDEAIEETNKVLEINPWDAEAITNKALAYIYKGDITKAKVIIEESREQKIYSDKIFFILAYIAMEKDLDFKKGEEYLMDAINLNPFSEIYYYNLACLYIKNKNYMRAINILSQILRLDASSKRVLFSLGQSYLLNNQEDKAIEIFEKLTRLAPTSIDGYLGLGRVYLKLGRYNKTLEYLYMAKRFDDRKLKYFNILEVYLQKYFYLLLLLCVAGIVSIAYILRRNKEFIPILE